MSDGYVLSDFKWGEPEFGTPSGRLEWSFAQSAGDYARYERFIDDPTAQTLVREAFAVWADVTAVSFVEVSDSNEVGIRLGWGPLDNRGEQVGYTWLVGFPNPVEGQAGRIGSAEIIFDVAEEWDYAKEPDLERPSFFATAIHEIGHALGMDHTPEGSLSMMAAFQAEITELQPGDVDGIQALYGILGQPTEGDDQLAGTSAGDVIDALDGQDTISGLMGNDDLRGRAGDDLFIGGIGDDTLDGGSGIDTAFYSGDQNSYVLTLTPTGTTLEDRRADGNGTDTLKSIEVMDFETDVTGSPFDLQQFGGATGLTGGDYESFIEFYIAYFNRAPDAVGLNFWGTAFANGVTLEEMATYFIDQDETRATYPDGTSNTDFVTAVYDNVLGRIPDQAGFDFWVDMLNRSDVTKVTRDQFILEVLRGVADGSPDRAYLEMKVDIGAYFAVHRGMSDLGNAADAMQLYDGTQGSMSDAVAAIDGYFQDALDPVGGEFLMQVTGVLDSPFILVM